ncbi:MAG TPA: rhodanese-like domain-containing protein [Bdellovibrio sp.]|uniref:rhodanese-like domain-containing protein n=1 Tax=Bdellovibrio sp. TaxID=28201 RepID=UPI002F0FEB05
MKLALMALVLFFQVGSAFAKLIILDVRTPEEYSQGHIDHALNYDVLNPNFSDRVSSLKRSDTYKVYCKGGKRATQAVQIMKELGFKDVISLGGYEDAQRAFHTDMPNEP